MIASGEPAVQGHEQNRELPKNTETDDAAPDKKKYKPSQQTLMATFTAVIAFYKYLMNEEYLYGNPTQIAKGDLIAGISSRIPRSRKFDG